MSDALFNEPRLARIYDLLEGERDDLDPYLAMVAEFDARSVLDVGCGTGAFACLLAERGIETVGVDPAAASLEVARTKPGAQGVRWLRGDATTLPELQVDLATMTGNTAQVFLTDDDWSATLRGIHAALRPSGHLVFEVRDPAGRAWARWNRETTHDVLDVPDLGRVESWIDVTDFDGTLMTYRRTYVIAADGSTLTSDSTRRFRSRDEIDASLRSAGYTVLDLRDAADRPGREWVFVAQKSS